MIDLRPFSAIGAAGVVVLALVFLAVRLRLVAMAIPFRGEFPRVADVRSPEEAVGPSAAKLIKRADHFLVAHVLVCKLCVQSMLLQLLLEPVYVENGPARFCRKLRV